MGLFDKIKRGITRGIGNAIGNATQKAVEKKATEVVAPKINQAADSIIQANQAASQVDRAKLEQALGSVNSSATSYATRVASNTKICPNCNASNAGDKKFCSECGSQLPEKTVGQGAICPNCGKQNNITEKFCSDCGTKLPIAIEAEEKAKQEDLAVMQEWEQKLAAYPKWQQGGTKYNIETYGPTEHIFSARFATYEQARQAVAMYREQLQQDGFKMAGQYPSVEHLYKKVNGVCYHAGTEHCFDGDSNHPSIEFNISEPLGGYEYVKPEPKKKKGLFGFFK